MIPPTKIPGLVSITEETIEGGGARFIFEIEDDKVEQFFSTFNLAAGDSEGFQRVVLEAIETMLKKSGGEE